MLVNWVQAGQKSHNSDGQAPLGTFSCQNSTNNVKAQQSQLKYQLLFLKQVFTWGESFKVNPREDASIFTMLSIKISAQYQSQRIKS